jgi:CheY-like chemotaxis protein
MVRKMEPSKLIYLVDDDEDDILLMKDALKNVMEDVDIVELSDGLSLLERLEKSEPQQPALILMDMNMPRVNGLEALHLIKTNPKTQHIPLVMVSTSASPQHISEAYQHGVNAFITKPVSINDYELMACTVNACYLNNYKALYSLKAPKKFKGKSILVVEDDPDQWEMMSHIFRMRMPDVNITRTNDPTSTLDYLTDQWKTSKASPELIILDLYLPTRREGLNLLDSFRYFFAIHRLQPVPIIVFTHSESEEDMKLSYTHKANAYMVKSRDFTQSIAYLETLCHFWWHTIALPKKTD